MKVNELTKGMLLTTSSGSNFFEMRSTLDLNVTVCYVGSKLHLSRGRKLSSTGIYLGTREDLGLEQDPKGWSNKFILIDSEIFAVDPPSWRYISPVQK